MDLYNTKTREEVMKMVYFLGTFILLFFAGANPSHTKASLIPPADATKAGPTQLPDTSSSQAPPSKTTSPKTTDTRGTKKEKAKVYHLNIDYGDVNFTGHNKEAMMINGQLPAPTLYFEEGEKALIHVTNKMDVESSIHWHGILLPNFQDGVSYLTTPPIRPGKTHKFEFTLRQSGTYWYHSHTGLQEQRGLYGAIVVQPRKKRHSYNHELVLVLSDWTDENPKEVLRTLKKGSEWYALKKGSALSLWEVLKHKALGAQFMLWGQRMPGMDISDVYYDSFLINGQRKQKYPDFKAGEKIRVRIVNASASTYFWISFGGQPPLLISADGVDVKPLPASKILQAVAETYDFLITIPENQALEIKATAQDGTGFATALIGKGEVLKAPTISKPDPVREMKRMALMHVGHDVHHEEAGGPHSHSKGHEEAGGPHSHSKGHEEVGGSHSHSKGHEEAGGPHSHSKGHTAHGAHVLGHKKNRAIYDHTSDHKEAHSKGHNTPMAKQSPTPHAQNKQALQNKQPSGPHTAHLPVKNIPAQNIGTPASPVDRQTSDSTQKTSQSTKHDNQVTEPNKHTSNRKPNTVEGHTHQTIKKPKPQLKAQSTEKPAEEKPKPQLKAQSGEKPAGEKPKPQLKAQSTEKPAEEKPSANQPDKHIVKKEGPHSHSKKPAKALPPAQGPVFSYSQLEALNKTAFSNPHLKEIHLNLTGNMWRYVWSFNGKTLSESDKIQIRKGETLRVHLHNKTMMHHPMHLHGHFFRVLNGQGEKSPLKHTVDVPPMQTVIIEFNPEEKGDWFFHCHILYHMKSGMSRVFSHGSTRDPRLKDYPLSKVFKADRTWYGYGEMDTMSNKVSIESTLSNIKNKIILEGTFSWVDHRYNLKSNFETEFSYEYFATDFFRVYGALELEKEQPNPSLEEQHSLFHLEDISAEIKAKAGVRYLLPYFVELDLSVDSQLRPEIGLEYELLLFPWVEFFVAWAWTADFGLINRLSDSTIMAHDFEWTLGLHYILSKNISLTASYDNHFSWGAGLHWKF